MRKLRKAEMITARSRLSGKGNVRLKWKLEYLKFCDMEEELEIDNYEEKNS